MRALYWRRPTAAEVGDIGLKPEDFEEPHVDLWPENWPAIELFTRYSTQWRVGAGGPVGLDYTVILHDLDRRKISGDDHDELMASIRVIEHAALDEIHKS